jgi:hypothetical protein
VALLIVARFWTKTYQSGMLALQKMQHRSQCATLNRLCGTLDPLPPIRLGEVRRLGFPLITVCGLCNHSAVLPIDVAKDFPDEATMHA